MVIDRNLKFARIVEAVAQRTGGPGDVGVQAHIAEPHIGEESGALAERQD